MFNLFNRKPKKELVAACKSLIELNEKMIADLEDYQEEISSFAKNFNELCGDGK